MDKRNEKLKVINLYGAPGTGKSATRSGLFWLMKIKRMSVEEVSEYAKYLVLANRAWQLEKDQLYVLAKQHHKLLILEGQYEFAVTDSPLLLASFYAHESTPKSFHGLCLDYDDGFDNLNLFLHRELDDGSFESQGRIHGLEQSKEIEVRQKEFLAKSGKEWIDVNLDHRTPWEILELLEGRWPGCVPAGGPLPPEISAEG